MSGPHGITEFAYDRMTDRHTMEQPTQILRWNNGILEQRWDITRFEDGISVEMTDEWRPIPRVGNA